MTSGGTAPSEPEPSAPGEVAGGASAAEDLPREFAGSGGTIERETGDAGPRSATSGAPAVGGAPPVIDEPEVIDEPVCDPADDHSTPDMVLPCAVSSALYVCRNCHSNPPLKSVGTSYVTFADIKGNAPLIYGVIKSGTMPWPPYTMSVWQKSTALKWLGKNGSCALGASRGCQ